MNDLMEVRGALGEPEPPSDAARSAARAALLQQASVARAPGFAPAGAPMAPPRRRRAFWLTGGAGLAAAAAAVAAVLATSPAGAPGPAGTRSGLAVSDMSARQILLDAATRAASKPEASGKYWYVKQTGPGPADKTTTQNWYDHNGDDFELSPYHKVVYFTGSTGFVVGSSSLTYAQIQRLPTNPAALTAWITRSCTHTPVPTAPGPPGAGSPSPRPADGTRLSPPRPEIPGDVAESLQSLLGAEPAPPALRAAAFRALAALPDVTKLGETSDAVILRVTFPKPPANKWPHGRRPPGTGQMDLTISTSTLTLRSWTDYTGTTTLLAAGWTGQRPRLVSIDKAFPPWARHH